MKRFFKWTGIILLAVILGLWITIELKQNQTFSAPLTPLSATKDSALIARGKHLVFGPAHCVNCHGAANADHNSENIPLTGGFQFDLPIGKIYTKNLTPDASGIGNLSDADIVRALRYGISSKGKALFNFMPFHNTSDSDLVAILSYLRNQPPVKNVVPDNEMNFLGKAVTAFLIKPVGPDEPLQKSVKPDTTASYGMYLANNVANCKGCHTNRDMMTGAFIGEEYAGGLSMETATDSGTYVITSPNLTPDKSGRISDWNLKLFINRFRQGALVAQSHMPWKAFGKMSDDELTAIYKYLQTLKPVKAATAPVKVVK